jgi:hypothetical protein
LYFLYYYNIYLNNVRRANRIVNEDIIYRFEKELMNKVALKMVPNLTEEQCLAKFFKFFDLHNTGKYILTPRFLRSKGVDEDTREDRSYFGKGA